MSEQQPAEQGLTRKQLIGAGAGAAAGALLAQSGVDQAMAKGKSKSGGRKNLVGMNMILFITDQERAIQHFPPNWMRKNLPGMRRLRRHGLTFEHAFTNACMCSPARSTLMSGYFPAQHGVKYTLEENMPAEGSVNENGEPIEPTYPQANLPTDLANLATVMTGAGYHVAYKGKWHCSKPETPGDATPADLEKYGFLRWNPPDAGANQTVPEAGGGYVDNDGRFMERGGNNVEGEEGVLEYLDERATQEEPFFLVVSLVNPHDVLFYPSRTFEEAGYDRSWLEGEIGIPETNDEELSTKPKVQEQFLRIFNLTGKPNKDAEKRSYLNFYGNLMKSSDNYLVEVLDKLEQLGLMDDTLIVRTSDHGEMGLTHGGMRQKNFNFYEETTRVPLTFSNPKLFPEEETTDALVSHVDFLPTLASLAGAPPAARRKWQGVDYSKLVLNPKRGGSVQDYVVFTYDDFQSGQANGPYPKPPNHIVSIREERWKLAKYYDVNPDPKERKAPEWEMYDLKHDPLEKRNLAHPGTELTKTERREMARLKRKLRRVEKQRLHPKPERL